MPCRAVLFRSSESKIKLKEVERTLQACQQLLDAGVSPVLAAGLEEEEEEAEE